MDNGKRSIKRCGYFMLVRRGKNVPTLSRVLYRVEKDEAVHESNSAKMTQIRDWSLFMSEMAPKRNVFLGKNFADPTIKKSEFFFTQPQISITK
jgi:hypothetical protein